MVDVIGCDNGKAVVKSSDFKVSVVGKPVFETDVVIGTEFVLDGTEVLKLALVVSSCVITCDVDCKVVSSSILFDKVGVGDVVVGKVA